LEYGVAREKMVLDEPEELALINRRRIKHVWVRGGLGKKSESLSKKAITWEEDEDGGGRNEF
jgi:hypothetical protein